MAVASPASPKNSPEKPAPKEHPILFQSYFKSVGTRTYAAQVKQAGNGNQFLVLTEGSRKKDSDELRKTRLFVFAEDFQAFFDLMRQAADFIRKNPVEEKVRRRQMAFWKKVNERSASTGETAPSGR